MNINGENFTLSDLSRGKIKEKFINEKFDRNITGVSLNPRLDISDRENLLQNQPEESLYIENKNYPILDQLKNIYNGGYIFSTLPYPYELIYENGKYKIELVFPETYDNPLSLQISAPNPYITKTPKPKKARQNRNVSQRPSPTPKTLRVMR